MHASSLENMQKCYENYIKKWSWSRKGKISVIDIGGVNINGTYADIFSGEEFIYKSADILAGENIDIVLEDPYKLPFQNESLDILISGQAFEHVEFFWQLFAEMVRVLKRDGLIIIIASSAGPIYSYPVDCYRFYPDAYRALAKYTRCNLLDIWLDQRGPWKDLVGVFCKQSLKEVNKLLCNEPEFTWQSNRFEKEISPIALVEKRNDKSIELIQGDIDYIEALSRLHKELQPNFYLEIGVRLGRSLQLANCESLGIDPQFDIKVKLRENHQLVNSTSDSFFETLSEDVFRTKKIDLAFIDGMHLFEFALRDFINVESYSSPHTVVAIDDVFPNHSIQSQRERNSRVWAGDVWKFAQCLTSARPDLNLTYLNTRPTGLLIITGLKSNNKLLVEKYNPLVAQYKPMLLQGENEQNIINRVGALESMELSYWEWLIQFVKIVKKAPKNRQNKLSDSLLQSWKKRDHYELTED